MEEVSADGSPVGGADASSPGKEQTAATTIPPRRNRITFGFAALSLSVPDRVRFRYRLDGFDRDDGAVLGERFGTEL